MATWHTSDVFRTGPADDGNVYVGLRDRAVPPAFPDWRWYAPIDAIEQEVLATSLTAISTGLPVEVLLQDVPAYSKILALYVSKNS